MNRKFTRPLVMWAAIASLLIVTTGCPKTTKDRNVFFARNLLSSVRAVEAVIVAGRPDLKAKWDKVIDNASKIVDAVGASDSVTTATLIRDILPTFNEVAAAFTNNRAFLIGIAIGEIALDYFINQFEPGPPLIAKRGDPVTTFKARRKITCRDSVSGQYKKMAYCEANPDTTQVERR